MGSGVMVGPGLMLTATHVLDEFSRDGGGPVCLTFLPKGARAWLPIDAASVSRPNQFDKTRHAQSDMSLVSCTLNSKAYANLPLMLAPMKVAQPLIGERLWAVGFRHQKIDRGAAHITPLVSSGMVTAAFPQGRGERMPSPCFEVAMETLGGMSGGAVTNADGDLVGIVSSSPDGGPSYITLIWEALRMRVRGAIPSLQRQDTISLIGASQLGQARLKGDVRRNPWGEIRLRLSSEESELIRASVPASPGEWGKIELTDDELEAFEERWGATLEALGNDATIAALRGFSLQRCLQFVASPTVPAHCLKAIEAFSVEDFEGVENLEISGAFIDENGDTVLDYFFEMQTLIWTLTVPIELYRRHERDFHEHFVNATMVGEQAELKVIQRGFFRAETTFLKADEVFTGLVITSSAMRPPR